MFTNNQPDPTGDVDLDELLRAAETGVRSYPDVIPQLIRAVKKLSDEVRGERMRQATHAASGWP
jgi:phosphoenolpyruvate carboxylase